MIASFHLDKLLCTSLLHQRQASPPTASHISNIIPFHRNMILAQRFFCWIGTSFLYDKIYNKKRITAKQKSLRGANRIWTGDKGVADPCLTAWLCRHIIFLMTPTGIEPVLPPWKGDVLTAWPRSLIKAPPAGLEPTTLRLTAACSTDWAKEE